MTIENFLKKQISFLESKGIQTAQLDIEVLVADDMKKDRSWLHAHLDTQLTPDKMATLTQKIERRAQHEPLAYIRGKQEFFGRDFEVSPDTLTPRPETETMLELFFAEFKQHEGKLQIIDIGTGSGCIIITAALELGPDHQYNGIDISKPALKIARKNAQTHNVEITFNEFNLLKEDFSSLIIDDCPLVVLANLPYVPTDFKINLAASHEPSFAIYGGDDGLDYYRALFKQLTHSQSTIFTESLPPQHENLKEIAKAYGFQETKSQDFIQVFRQQERKAPLN